MKPRQCAVIAAGSEPTRAAGERLLELGGNAVDVAVGAAMTAMIAEILMCSPGGSAQVMLRVGRVTELIEGCDAMPGQGPARPEGEVAAPRWRELDLPGDHGRRLRVRAGHAAVAVPGALAALETAWRRHGSLPWRELVAPGHELARAGIPAAPETARWLSSAAELYAGDELTRGFFPDAAAPAAGVLLRIPHLADALDYIAREGARAFYRGDIAALFARDMAAHGGLVTREDLAAYQAAVRRPLALASRQLEVALAPPPSAAGALAGALIGLLELDWDLHPGDAKRALHHARVQAHVLAHAGARAPALADAIRQAAIELDVEAARALLAPAALLGHAEVLRSPSTTHVSVVADDGAAVAITLTMGHGAGVSIPGTGIPCNGSAGETELDGDGRYLTRPGARLISNLCPTIAFSERAGSVVALGAVGGPRAPTALAQTWLAYAREGMPVEAAVIAPRLHVERTSEGRSRSLVVYCEPGIPTRLLEQSFAVQPFDAPDRYFGRVTLAARDARGHLHAATDSR